MAAGVLFVNRGLGIPLSMDGKLLSVIAFPLSLFQARAQLQ
jgi:hypothetical protein